MSITDELRKYATVSWDPWTAARDQLFQMCDHIDAEHQKVIRELNNLADAIADTSVFLPVDADGEHIHIGDKVTLYGLHVYKVDGIHFYKDRVSVSFSGESGCGSESANNVHHYHELTVEDVIDELLLKWSDCETPEQELALKADVIARLRLAGDGE